MFDSRSKRINCPYCGEPIEVLVDTSVDYQEYIEDCSVCCRPIALQVTVVEDAVSVFARDENDA